MGEKAALLSGLWCLFEDGEKWGRSCVLLYGESKGQLFTRMLLPCLTRAMSVCYVFNFRRKGKKDPLVCPGLPLCWGHWGFFFIQSEVFMLFYF